MALHIHYETMPPFALTRTDVPDEKARAAGLLPKCILRAHPDTGRLTLDSETTLDGVPTEAWRYRLGNRCAIDWVLDQYKEKKPKDPTIRAKFDTYRFADHKEAGDRPARARDGGERADGADRGGDEGGCTMSGLSIRHRGPRFSRGGFLLLRA